MRPAEVSCKVGKMSTLRKTSRGLERKFSEQLENKREKGFCEKCFLRFALPQGSWSGVRREHR